MRQVIYGDDARFIEWAERRIGVEFRSDAKAIGMVRSDDVGPPNANRDDQGRRIIAAVVFDTFSPYNCYMHIASDGSATWMTRELLVKSFTYPFIQCGMLRVTGMVPAKNIATIEFDKHIGFEVEGRCKGALPDDDIIILGLTKSRCRFIPKEHHYGR